MFKKNMQKCDEVDWVYTTNKQLCDENVCSFTGHKCGQYRQLVLT